MAFYTALFAAGSFVTSVLLMGLEKYVPVGDVTDTLICFGGGLLTAYGVRFWLSR